MNEREMESFFRNGGLESIGIFLSTYQAKVRDNNDPEKRGRLKINCAMVYGSEDFEEWVEPRGMPAGSGVGLFLLPQVGDLVWLSCREGNAQKPLWEYGAFKENAIPEKAKTDYPDQMVLAYGNLFFQMDKKANKLTLGNDAYSFKQLFYEFIDLVYTKMTIVTALGPQNFQSMPANQALLTAFKQKFEQVFK